MMTTRLSTLLCTGVAAALVAGAGEAAAEKVRYAGPHPIASEVTGKFCYIEVGHTHRYRPDSTDGMVVNKSGSLSFLGDPSAHGYEGPLFSYNGAHPYRAGPEELSESPEQDGACRLDGVHFHIDAPDEEADYSQVAGAYKFTGKLPVAPVAAAVDGGAATEASDSAPGTVSKSAEASVKPTASSSRRTKRTAASSKRATRRSKKARANTEEDKRDATVSSSSTASGSVTASSSAASSSSGSTGPTVAAGWFIFDRR